MLISAAVHSDSHGRAASGKGYVTWPSQDASQTASVPIYRRSSQRATFIPATRRKVLLDWTMAAPDMVSALFLILRSDEKSGEQDILRESSDPVDLESEVGSCCFFKR